jgi:hypothetical protein
MRTEAQMSLQDYATRKYDYLGLQGVKPHGSNRLGLALFEPDSNGQICVGVQKLAQRWLLEFMTENGSMPGAPTRGCAFMRAVRQGRLRTQVEVLSLFSASNVTIRQNLQAEEYAGMPDDERFIGADLTSVAILPGYMQLNVKINSLAGTARTVIFPISTLPSG